MCSAAIGRFLFLFLKNKPNIFHFFAVFRAGGNNINSCCVDTAVAENIRKLCNIFFNTIKCACKQVA